MEPPYPEPPFYVEIVDMLPRYKGDVVLVTKVYDADGITYFKLGSDKHGCGWLPIHFERPTLKTAIVEATRVINNAGRELTAVSLAFDAAWKKEKRN